MGQFLLKKRFLLLPYFRLDDLVCIRYNMVNWSGSVKSSSELDLVLGENSDPIMLN